MSAKGAEYSTYSSLMWQSAHQWLLNEKALHGLLPSGTMNAHTSLFQHLTTGLLGQITEGSGRQDVAFDVLDPGPHNPLLRWIRGRIWIDFEGIPFGALRIRSLHDRITNTGTGDRALGVINDDPCYNGIKPLEGAPVTAEPCLH